MFFFYGIKNFFQCELKKHFIMKCLKNKTPINGIKNNTIKKKMKQYLIKK